ncbi:hypothetical protein CRG98_012552, partial [Punica granatum]
METACSPYFCCILMTTALLFVSRLCAPVDTITSSSPMNGNQTLISDGGTFELGFFSPRNSGPVYLGIWFHNIPTRTVVWVANRDSPVNDSSSVALKIGNDGDLVL